jgi:hypothetical protein
MHDYTAVPLFLRWIVCRLGVHFLGPGVNVLPTEFYRRRGYPLCEHGCLRCGKWVSVVDRGHWFGPVFDRT